MMKRFFCEKVKNVHIIIAAVLTIVMLGVMDIYSLPAIAKAAGGLPAFDLRTFGYSHQEAVLFLTALSESGKNLFLHFQLPLDFAFAFVYTFLFLALIIRLHPVGIKLAAAPLVLFALDIAENALSVIMLKSDCVSQALTAVGSTVTLLKNVFTLICTVIIIVLLIMWFIKRKKAK